MTAADPRALRRPGGPGGEVAVAAAAAGVFVVVAVTAQVAVRLGGYYAGIDQSVPVNPVELGARLRRGEVVWPPAATPVAVAVVVLLAGLAVGGVAVVRARRRSRSRVDHAAARMARATDLAGLSQESAAKAAGRLGAATTPGIRLGRSVATGEMLWAGWEDLHLDIWGPRSGKTTSRVIPTILDAPGLVVATSNKSDVVQACAGPRERVGPVWIFDPQRIATEECTWYWDPLDYVASDPDRDAAAASLAALFAANAAADGAKSDAFFSAAAEQLVANYFLAAACAGLPITRTYEWVSNDRNSEAVQLLRDAGWTMQASDLQATLTTTERTRSGIFATAKVMLAPLALSAVQPWITAGEDRRRFSVSDFAHDDTATLFVLSKEGARSAGALTTALTVAVMEALERRGERAGGWLPVPAIAALDEVANVVRWRELPSLYSHYGSRGIIMMAILQSYNQGVGLWGREGMAKLWSAATVAVYGGGNREKDFLADLSELIGEHEEYETSASVSSSGAGSSTSRSQNRQVVRKRTMTVADLQALPRGRAVVLTSGNPPTLIAPVPWFAGDRAAEVEAAIAAARTARANEWSQDHQ